MGSDIKKAEPIISLPRRLWRWWQIPTLSWLCVITNEPVDENSTIPTLLTVSGISTVMIAVTYFFVAEVINWKRNRVDYEPPELLKNFMNDYGYDGIQFRTIDSFRFWQHYAGTCKVLGRKKDASAAYKKAQELRGELMIIKLAKI